MKKRNRYENPDPTPVALPFRFARLPTQEEQIKNSIQRAQNSFREDGIETAEDAEDFDVPGDFLPARDFNTPWEYDVSQEQMDRAKRLEERERLQKEEEAALFKSRKRQERIDKLIADEDAAAANPPEPKA